MKIHIPQIYWLSGFAAFIPHPSSLIPLLALFFLNSSRLEAQSCIGTQGRLEWRLYENLSTGSDIRVMYTHPRFPQAPHGTETLSNLQTSTSYNNNYGSLIRGFIKAPLTGQYQFNLTGDDRSLFYLSTDSFPANMTLKAEVPGWSGTTEHTKYPEQTSAIINLVAGNYYYFETRHLEGGGGDFIWAYWKTPATIGGTTWAIVPATQVYDYTCDANCPVAGTSCNDNNAATMNDQQDGNCGCSGTPTTLPFACIGERGRVMALYYDGISGTTVANMLADPDYPLAPNRSGILTSFTGPGTALSNYGTRVRGYIRAPATGNYTFNVSGDNEVRFRLSANETATAANEICYNDGQNSAFDHYNTPQQTSAPYAMTAGNFYSFELLHKEQTNNEYFYVYWKTPLNQDTFFHIIDGSYLYRYNCETACIPAGTPCNDGNPNTFNDVYGAACGPCTGTPCSDPECTNSFDYVPLEPCDAESDRHSTNPNSSWLSCQPTQSPNPERGISHWIQYDFGAIYALGNAEIWNYNAVNATAQGFKDVVIDFSADGVNWSNLGTYTWGQAPGTPAYTGFDMSAFNGISARYVLITALNTYGNSACAGISEIFFNATTCPTAGTPCDDGNPETTGDTYNSFCYCVGISSGINECEDVNLVKNEVPIPSGEYDAQLTITSSGLVRTGYNVSFIAGESVTLNGGFEVELGGEFLAAIAPCAPNNRGFLGKIFKGKKKKVSGQLN